MDISPFRICDTGHISKYWTCMDFCSWPARWFMEVTMELISNPIFFSQGTKKITKFKWKLEEGRLSKVF